MVGANLQRAEYINTIQYWSAVFYSKIAIIHQLNLAFDKSWVLSHTHDVSWVLPLFFHSLRSKAFIFFAAIQCCCIVSKTNYHLPPEFYCSHHLVDDSFTHTMIIKYKLCVQRIAMKLWSCCSDFTDFLVVDTSYLDYFQVRESTRIFQRII